MTDIAATVVKGSSYIAAIDLPMLASSMFGPDDLKKLIKDRTGELPVYIEAWSSPPSWWPSDMTDGDLFAEAWTCESSPMTITIPEPPIGELKTRVVPRVHEQCASVGPEPPPPTPPEPPKQSRCSGPMDDRQAVALAAKAWFDLWHTDPSWEQIILATAVMRHETYYARAARPPSWKGNCNWGATQGQGDAGCFKSDDLNPIKGTREPQCFASYSSDAQGITAALKRMGKIPTSATHKLYDFARHLRDRSYYGTTVGPDHTLATAPEADKRADAENYATALKHHVEKINAAMNGAAHIDLTTKAPGGIANALEEASPFEIVIGAALITGLVALVIKEAKNGK